MNRQTGGVSWITIKFNPPAPHTNPGAGQSTLSIHSQQVREFATITRHTKGLHTAKSGQK